MASQNQTVDLTVTLDKDLMANGEELFRSLGMDFSTAFSAFVSQTIKRGSLPFELDAVGQSAESVQETKEEYYAELRRRADDMGAGRNCAYHEIIEVDD